MGSNLATTTGVIKYEDDDGDEEDEEEVDEV
jgi:hypothetical protein